MEAMVNGALRPRLCKNALFFTVCLISRLRFCSSSGGRRLGVVVVLGVADRKNNEHSYFQAAMALISGPIPIILIMRLML